MIKAKDRDKNGKIKDARKTKAFFVFEQELKNKTELEGVRKTVFLDRYSLKGEKGEVKEFYPEQMWMRIAKGIAQFEKNKKLRDEWEKKFYDVIEDFKFVPAGRILSGAGTGYEVTFFNCYVIPSPSDSRGGIMENITQTVEIQSRAGGVGVNLSTLRPRGARVRKVNGTSSGPVNWASLYSTANHDVIQQGGSRRGALMLMLDDWHPDVEEFIEVKKDLTKIPGANLSVCVSDDFMQAVENDEDWKLYFPDYESEPEYDKYWDGDIKKWVSEGRKVKVYRTVKARRIWDKITEAAWNSAEPGVVFLERYNKRSNTWYFERIVATNPCGEQGLGPWAVCNLGAMNLAKYVDKNGDFDYESLDKDVKVAMRFMDNVVDANFYFYRETYDSQAKIRRTGLGTMGLGDALIMMKIPYGSDKSVEVIEKIYKTIRDSAYLASVDLAKEKGAFPNFDQEKYLKGWFIKRLPKEVRRQIAKHGIRNAVLLTQAPTGTTSLLAGVSSGIEPVYNFEFKRTDRTGEHTMYHDLYKKWREENPDGVKPDYFVCAMDLSPEEHLKVQAKVQEYTDSSISKTVNAPNSFTVEDVKRLYSLAYKWGCKGVTFFRDGSRQGVLESVSDKKKEEEQEETSKEPMMERSYKVTGATYKMDTPMGTAFITINEDEQGEPIEIFINVGKAGSDITAVAEALGRTVSTALRFRGALTPKERATEIAHQLSGIGGRRSVGFGASRIRSLPDAIAVALSHHLGIKANGHTLQTDKHLTNGLAKVVTEPEQSQESIFLQPQQSKADICPSCGASALVYEEGCSKCYVCGHSEC